MRKLADTSAGQRVTRYDPVTGNGYLTDPAVWDPADPATWVPVPWPLAGVELVEGPPKKHMLSMSWVGQAEQEGWVELEGRKVVHRPGGPEANPWQVTHTFLQASSITIHAVDGPVRYRVLENPDKWPDRKNENDEGFGGEVRWFYEVELA